MGWVQLDAVACRRPGRRRGSRRAACPASLATSFVTVVRGLLGVVVSIALTDVGASWASDDISLGRSLPLGGIIAIAGLLRLADAAWMVFRTVDGAER